MSLITVGKHVLPKLEGRNRNEILVADIGCSIGTFAIEFARAGFRTVGIDVDSEALEIARELALEEGVKTDFVCANLADWDGGQRPIDVAIAFDIFEHLHDDELGSLLATLRTKMRDGSFLVFHTFPTEYDYLFFEGDGYLARPLETLAHLPNDEFERLTKALALQVDIDRLIRGEQTHRDAIRLSQHCNPLTAERLRHILDRAGFEIINLNTDQLYPFNPEQIKKFNGQPIVHRNLYGAAKNFGKRS